MIQLYLIFFILSTNYDLLLYWVLMSNAAEKAIDDFGRDQLTNLNEEQYIDPEDFEGSELRWGNIKMNQQFIICMELFLYLRQVLTY